MRTATVTRSSEIFIFNDMKTIILASGSRPAGALFFIDVYVFFFILTHFFGIYN